MVFPLIDFPSRYGGNRSGPKRFPLSYIKKDKGLRQVSAIGQVTGGAQDGEDLIDCGPRLRVNGRSAARQIDRCRLAPGAFEVAHGIQVAIVHRHARSGSHEDPLALLPAGKFILMRREYVGAAGHNPAFTRPWRGWRRSSFSFNNRLQHHVRSDQRLVDEEFLLGLGNVHGCAAVRAGFPARPPNTDRPAPR